MAIKAFSRTLKVYTVSDVSKEVEASKSLSTLWGTFKNIATINYGVETLTIDKLVSVLTSPAYSEKVNVFIERYVQRTQITNDKFKVLFGSRIVVEASAEVYNLKVLRKEMMGRYSKFATYNQAVANAEDTRFSIWLSTY